MFLNFNIERCVFKVIGLLRLLLIGVAVTSVTSFSNNLYVFVRNCDKVSCEAESWSQPVYSLLDNFGQENDQCQDIPEAIVRYCILFNRYLSFTNVHHCL